MKTTYFKIGVIGVGLLTATFSRGQTNTFPSSGNVGIGTTSPASILTVSQNINGTAYVSMQNDNGGSSAVALSQVESNGYQTSMLITGDDYPSGSGPYAANSSVLFGDGAGGLRIASINSRLTFWTGNPGTEKMTVSMAGNVGIGTTSPYSLLDVAGIINSSTEYRFGNNSFSRLASYDGGGGFGGGYNFNWNDSGPINDSLGTSVGYAFAADGSIRFYATPSQAAGGTEIERMRITYSGNVGIGTSSPDQALSVNGTIHTKEVIVDNSGWPDYVFDSGYQLKPLSAVEKTIATDKHLPGMPSAKEVAAHGVKMGEMQAKLLAQLEEVTLRLIDQDKRQSTAEKRQTEEESLLQIQSQRIDHLEKENETLKAALAAAHAQ